MKADVGIIGLGVMGKSLALNIAGKGYSISLYNRPEPTLGENIADEIIAENEVLSGAKGFNELKPFIASLRIPRKVLLMIKADVVDKVLGQIEPLLQSGDVIIEGGNSHYLDTVLRSKKFEEKGIHFLGTGISGEEGALKGPSIMPGGSKYGFQLVEEILDKIAAKTSDGKSCMTFIGPNGAGHFVKMVHNGIEYGEMQIIAEIYTILRDGMGYNPSQIADVFEHWSGTGHRSYLLGITARILQKKEDNDWIIDKILDRSTAKGTGGWTVKTASDLGVSAPTITAALFARFQSEETKQRATAKHLYPTEKKMIELDVELLANAYKAARIINHHQGFQTIEKANSEFQWGINLPDLAKIWTNGCIIQSELMNDLAVVLKEGKPILSSAKIVPIIKNNKSSLTEVVALALNSGIPVPVLSSALNYFLAYAEKKSSANLIQAQRDYFGAHGIHWMDDPEGKSFHYNWYE